MCKKIYTSKADKIWGEGFNFAWARKKWDKLSPWTQTHGIHVDWDLIGYEWWMDPSISYQGALISQLPHTCMNSLTDVAVPPWLYTNLLLSQQCSFFSSYSITHVHSCSPSLHLPSENFHNDIVVLVHPKMHIETKGSKWFFNSLKGWGCKHSKQSEGATKDLKIVAMVTML